jgi:hypothetical protein
MTLCAPQIALSLRLVVAKALRRMHKLDEAEAHFKVLAGGAKREVVASFPVADYLPHAVVSLQTAGYWQDSQPGLRAPGLHICYLIACNRCRLGD